MQGLGHISTDPVIELNTVGPHWPVAVCLSESNVQNSSLARQIRAERRYEPHEKTWGTFAENGFFYEAAHKNRTALKNV